MLTYEERKQAMRDRYQNDPVYRETILERNRKRRKEKGAAYVRNNNLKAKFGITVEQYDEMLAAQGGACAICQGPPGGRWERFHVDHDHATGKVRGLLCHGCNTAIGLLGERHEVAERAAGYLKKHKE